MPDSNHAPPPHSTQGPTGVAIVGGGPAGLAAAEMLAAEGLAVDLFDAMPSVGRKFLLAGKGGLNLTHSEPAATFGQRYGDAAAPVGAWLRELDADGIRRWADGLGISTFVGSSGRVFPSEMKAAPLLRAWLHRLREAGVRLHMRHRWLGWASDGALRVAGPAGEITLRPRATVLALGGASWQRLGSDGAWWPWLAARGVPLAPLKPANCGFDVGWSEHLASRHEGAAVKSVALAFEGRHQQGEFVLTRTGVEGSLIYAFSAALRNRIEASGSATFALDLLPDRSLEWVAREVAHPRGPRSLSTHLKSRLGLHGPKAALLWEVLPRGSTPMPQQLAQAIKALPITVHAPRPIDEAISSAGGVRLDALDSRLMLRALPGVFCAGEMLDWEAPTGGYLLTACIASGRVAGLGAAHWLGTQPEHTG